MSSKKLWSPGSDVSVYGLALAVPTASETPSLALSIAVHAPAVDDARIAEWKSILSEEAATTRRGT